MEGPSSYSTRGDQRLPQIPSPPFVFNMPLPLPDVANAMPADEHGVSNPKGDGITQDRYARRLEKSRAYSKAYLQRKNAHIKFLEEKQDSLIQIISEENSMTQLYKGIGSVLKKERNILQETLSKINSNGEVQNVEIDRILHEIEQLKLTK